MKISCQEWESSFVCFFSDEIYTHVHASRTLRCDREGLISLIFSYEMMLSVYSSWFFR